jgi:hypothetical protein
MNSVLLMLSFILLLMHELCVESMSVVDCNLQTFNSRVDFDASKK